MKYAAPAAIMPMATASDYCEPIVEGVILSLEPAGVILLAPPVVGGPQHHAVVLLGMFATGGVIESPRLGVASKSVPLGAHFRASDGTVLFCRCELHPTHQLGAFASADACG